ncbi:MAG: DUF420 domain-containing protein [Candidatus Hodarchaeales archaeon]|jgi:putative membrane protein
MGFFGTPASEITDLALITVLLSAFFGTLGYYYLRYKRKPLMHLIFMITGVFLLWLFLTLYLTNYYLNGVKTFGGPFEAAIIYYPFLIIHIIGSTLMGIITAYQAITGIRRFDNKEEKEWEKFKFEKDYRIKHRFRGKIGVILWLWAAFSGLIVYFMLYVIYSPVLI